MNMSGIRLHGRLLVNNLEQIKFYNVQGTYKKWGEMLFNH